MKDIHTHFSSNQGKVLVQKQSMTVNSTAIQFHPKDQREQQSLQMKINKKRILSSNKTKQASTVDDGAAFHHQRQQSNPTYITNVLSQAQVPQQTKKSKNLSS